MKRSSGRRLIRALGLVSLIFYGVGDILGAGIYAIIGEIAGLAGRFAWLSFAIAMGVVSFTALSYAELVSRFPRSGGVSVYVQEAFGRRWLSILAGLLLLSASILSMSTLSQAFVGYLGSFGWHVPAWLGISGFLGILLMINLRGIHHSSMTNILSTTVEAGGLFIVLLCGLRYLLYPGNTAMTLAAGSLPTVKTIFMGAGLAFFAFTGFEDLVNVAEEAKQAAKNIPRAILFSIGIAGLLYLCVSWVATAVIPGSVLGQSHAPLLDVVKQAIPAMPSFLFAVIAIFAVSNTTLLNYITASRLLYGMSKARLLPVFLQGIHHRYHTPWKAILAIFPVILGLGLSGSLSDLAGSTSVVVLTVFSFSCLALITVKLKEQGQKKKTVHFHIPIIIPIVAMVLNMLTISFLPIGNILTALGFIVACVMISAGIAMQRKE